MLLQRWQGGAWKSFGGLWGYRASARPASRLAAAGSDRSSILRPSGARRPPGDNTRHRWHTSSPRSSARPSTTSWPRRGRCAAGRLVTYSPKVFIPLTTLCRDVCGYCTFARPPRRGERAYLPVDEVLEIARAGAAAGCTEALFTLGDKPELRYRVAREELARARLRDDDRVPRALRRPRARRDRAAAAPEPGRDEPGRARAAAPGIGVDGDHARDGLRPAVAEGRAALGIARQGARRPARDDPARRRARDPVHERHPDRHRRDAGGAARRAARAAGARRRARARRRGDRPELPRQAGHADGRPSGCDARRAALDGRRGPRRCSAPTGTCRRRRTSPTTTFRCSSTPGSTTGAASRRSRSITSIPRRRGPRSSGCARRPSRVGSPSRRACRSIPSTSPTSTAGSIRPSRPPCAAPRTRSASPARIAGRPASRSRCRSSSGATRCRSSSTGERARPGRDRAAALGARRASASGCSPPPTGCAARSAATRSPTS